LRGARRGDHSEALTLLNWPDALVRIARPGPACYIQADPARNPALLSLDCHFYSNKYTKNGGAKGIRTPDLLHAIQTFIVSQCGWIWLYQQF
jgi:hypothetical protein